MILRETVLFSLSILVAVQVFTTIVLINVVLDMIKHDNDTTTGPNGSASSIIPDSNKPHSNIVNGGEKSGNRNAWEQEPRHVDNAEDTGIEHFKKRPSVASDHVSHAYAEQHHHPPTLTPKPRSFPVPIKWPSTFHVTKKQAIPVYEANPHIIKPQNQRRVSVSKSRNFPPAPPAVSVTRALVTLMRTTTPKYTDEFLGSGYGFQEHPIPIDAVILHYFYYNNGRLSVLVPTNYKPANPQISLSRENLLPKIVDKIVEKIAAARAESRNTTGLIWFREEQLMKMMQNTTTRARTRLRVRRQQTDEDKEILVDSQKVYHQFDFSLNVK